MAKTKQWQPGDPFDSATSMGAIASQTQLDGIMAKLEANISGEVVCGGNTVKPVAGGYYLEPTIINDVDNASKIAQEEIFGPVLTVSSFDTEAQALELANDTVYGLGAGVWTANLARAHRMTRDMRAGMVWANDYNALGIDRPFGGVRGSGTGRDKGIQAMWQYTTTKTGWINFS